MMPIVQPIKIDSNIKTNIKDGILHGLSIPAKHKKNLMYNNLKKSEYINKYLDNNVIIDKLEMLNNHIKFGLVYGVTFFETMQQEQVVELPEQK